MTIRLLLKTESDQMFPVRREMLRRNKKAFDARNIQLGIPHRIDRSE